MIRSVRLAGTVVLCAVAIACSGGTPQTAPPPLIVTPASLVFSGYGDAVTATLTASQAGYGGQFTATTANAAVATITPLPASSSQFVVTAVGIGQTTLTITDSTGASKTVNVSTDVPYAGDTPSPTPAPSPSPTSSASPFPGTYAMCVVTDAIQADNQAPPSTNCETEMYVAIGAAPSTITISNIPNGTYSWSAAGVGATMLYGPPCSSSNIAPYYTVTPASATGTSVTFQFSATGATANAQLQCSGTFVNQNGTPILIGPNQPLIGALLVNEYPANP
jgi:hypothetical protein